MEIQQALLTSPDGNLDADSLHVELVRVSLLLVYGCRTIYHDVYDKIIAMNNSTENISD